jgi:hypothetical protein
VRCLVHPDVNLNPTHSRQFQALLLSTMLEHTNLSRANSRNSARSRNGSSLSRNQSLIKKNIQLQDLKPADVLIERFVAWKAIVQQLTAYFEVCFEPLLSRPCSYSQGHCGYRNQHCERVDQTRRCYSTPFQSWESVSG